MEQAIRFLTADDGVKLAYATPASGPALLKTANWLNHLEYDWQSPVWSHWFTLLSRHHTLYRYDQRGSGLSDRADADLSFERQVADLEQIANTAGLERFALLGLSQGAAVAIEYAVRHPERVSHMVLHGGFARGWAVRSPESLRAGRAMSELVRRRLGRGHLRLPPHVRRAAHAAGQRRAGASGSASCSGVRPRRRSRPASWMPRAIST